VEAGDHLSNPMHSVPESTNLSEIPSDSAESLTILIVDDEPLVGKCIGAFLAEYGHKVLCLDSHDDAIQHIRFMRFDAAFVGAIMPEPQDGNDVCALIKTLSPKTRVFLFMEPISEEWAMNLQRDGFNVEFFRCPFEQKELLALIDSVKATRARIRQRLSSS
jgi:DNA-binding NtrC family response regulator